MDVEEAKPKEPESENLTKTATEGKSEQKPPQDNKDDARQNNRLKMQVLLSNFSEPQLNRYEMYRRATFPRASVKRLMQAVAGTTVAPNVVIAMAGIAKVYIGEIVETALDVMESWDEQPPLQPKHIREAMRRLKNKEMISRTRNFSSFMS